MKKGTGHDSLKAPATVPQRVRDHIDSLIACKSAGFFEPIDIGLLQELAQQEITSEETQKELAAARKKRPVDTERVERLVTSGGATSDRIRKLRVKLRLTPQTRRRADASEGNGAAREGAVLAPGVRPWWAALRPNPPRSGWGCVEADAISRALEDIGKLDQALRLQARGEWDEVLAHHLFDATQDPQSLRSMFRR